MKIFKSKTDKEEDARQASLDVERQRLRQFQMESVSILEEAIAELEATKSVLKAPAEYEVARVEVPTPQVDFVVALDPGANVISVVDVDDVASSVSMDQKVQTLQGLVSSGGLAEGKMSRTKMEDSTIISVGGKGLVIGAVWHGDLTNVEDDMTRSSWESALEFFDGTFPDSPSETDTLTLYNSIRASFGKDVVEIEGMGAVPTRAAPAKGTASGAVQDRSDILREVDDLIKDLRARGLSTTRLHEIRTMPIKDARRALDKFTSDLRLVHLLEARFYKLDATNFPEECESIFSKLSSISHLTEAAMEIGALEGMVAEWEAQEASQGITADGFDVTVEGKGGFADVMDGIKSLELSGYDTRFIYRMLYSGDIEVARQALFTCLANVERLKKAEESLLKMWAEGYEDRFMAIQKRLTDPAMAATVERDLGALEAKMKADAERERIFTLLRGRLEAWSRDGFNVEELRSVLTKDPDTIIETFKRFSSKLNFLVKLEDEVNTLEAQMEDKGAYFEELANIRRMLMDPSRTTEIMDEIRTLRFLVSRRGDEEAVREVIRTKIARWWERGYDVSVLQQHKDQPVEVLEDIVGEFEAFVRILADVEKELDSLYLEGFEEDEKQLRGMLHDIKNVSLAREELKLLKEKVALRIREEDKARASGSMEAGPPIKSPSLLATIVLRIGHRLPVALWGREPGEIAEEMLGSEYGTTKEGQLIVKVGRRWYFGDPRREDRFLTPYTVGHGGGKKK